ncbi:aldehyde dehydrogenase [Acetobacterium sp. KB-1]|jgi:aldehyde dehydrogenase (NAD+)|uniref:aldehyde dehydrogenase n=1 Tax=Acetobacterium sp. KB-1 TaxID=2184575 RepID=UPI000DBEB462|nr:aldehyde dehydrogenase [Acetobacterium sp. KB-1]AWW27471.1 aldehyde dehydrogenase family protein [Acetobacterium sp. KB-1]
MDSIKKVVDDQRAYFLSGETKSIDFRKKQLNILKKAIQKNELAIMAALKKDLNKSAFEAYATEIGIVLEEIGFMLKNIKRLAKSKRVKTPITQFLSSSRVYQEPYGVVLIMSPWNYPFQLTLVPLVAAIATGNCAMIKPSNYSPHTSKLIGEIISSHFDPGYISFTEGGREANESLLEQKFDYIFFTGSVAVGKTIMAKAAAHLTPVTLELGGKSPCIVDKTANINLAARRIAWGKYLNAGQTCVAPDYLVIHESIKDEFIKALQKNIIKMYGKNPLNNNDFPKIINKKHFDRLTGLIDEQNVIIGGKSNLLSNQIEPTVLDPVGWEDVIMQEEIFGPVLPIIVFRELSEVVKKVSQRPKPLALYLFTTSKQNEKIIIDGLSFGGGCINDTVVQVASSYMAFGGVGESGMGSYHGEASFRTLSHCKGVLKKSNKLDICLRYPPFNDAHLKRVKKIMK